MLLDKIKTERVNLIQTVGDPTDVCNDRAVSNLPAVSIVPTKIIKNKDCFTLVLPPY